MKTKTAAVVLAMTIGLVGCKASTGGNVGKGSFRTETAENAVAYTVNRVALLDAVNTSGDTDGDEMVEYLVRALHASGKYQFASAAEFARDAARAGVEADHDRLAQTWKQRRTVEPRLAEGVLTATSYDALLALEVTHWEELQIQATQEGSSSTTVGIRVRMYAADGTLLWTGSDRRTVDSAPYLPEFNQRATATGQIRTTSSAAVPEPPRVETVAPLVAEELAAAMPVIRPDEAAPEDE